ncbi:MAG TPA: energy transducer TonB [Gemmatimonadales bacterium]|nr:energy transducer TonB [Gemmatimonadales bacterium]
MFENLIESGRKPKASLGQQVVSLVIHVGIIFGAVKATQGAAEVIKEIAVDTTMVFLKPPEAPPPPPPPQEQVVVSANPPPQGFQVITPPDNIPTEIPPVNLNERFDPKDFTGKGVEGGIAAGVVGGTGPVPTIEGQVFLAAEVDEQPSMKSGAECVKALTDAYPPVMKSAGIPGKVSLQFVVNTDGRVDPGTVKVMSSSHKAFEGPAKEVITSPACTFKSGTSRGQPVRVLVQQGVSFKLAQ